MKKTKPKKETPQKKTTHTAYIGIATLFAIGLFGIHSLGIVSDLFTQDNPVVTVPTVPPLPPVNQSPQMPALQPTPAPQAKKTEEPVAAPVLAPIEPFAITMPLDGEILTPYSPEKLIFSKTMGDWRTHPGIDITTDSGTAVMAAAKGTVIRAEEEMLMGHTIEIEHENGYKTIYANLASTEMVKIGQQVESGQVIAASGNSARAELLEKSHLHFALMHGEDYADPSDYLKE